MMGLVNNYDGVNGASRKWLSLLGPRGAPEPHADIVEYAVESHEAGMRGL